VEPGWGLISNNTRHVRGGFSDQQGHPQRLLYRARYFDRIANSGIDSIDDNELAEMNGQKKGGPLPEPPLFQSAVS